MECFYNQKLDEIYNFLLVKWSDSSLDCVASFERFLETYWKY